MLTRSLLTLAISVIVVFVLSCEWLLTRHYNVDKLSPNGTYRVKVAVKVRDEGGLSGHFTDQGSIQVMKGQETVYADDWNYRDNWESSFIDNYPVIEWVANNILRMGHDLSRQPFTNELTISNQTAENLKHIGFSTAKNESFEVFDIAPGTSVTVRSSPHFDPTPVNKVSIGYGGETQSGKRLVGTLEQEQPGNSIKLQITIRPEDVN